MVPDELAAPPGQELIELLVCKAPHEFLVFLEPSGRKESPHEAAEFVVCGRVHGDHELVHRQLIPVLVDGRSGVVSVHRNGEPGKGASGCVAGRVGVVVAENSHGFGMSGHHRHAVLRLDPDRTFGFAQEFEIRVRVVDQGVIREEVDALEGGIGVFQQWSSSVVGGNKS